MSKHFLVEIEDDSSSIEDNESIISDNSNASTGVSDIDYDSDSSVDDTSFILFLPDPTYLKALSNLSDPYNIIGILGEKSVRLCGISSNVNRIISIEVKDFTIHSSDEYNGVIFPLKLYNLNLCDLKTLIVTKDNNMIKLSSNTITNDTSCEYNIDDSPPYLDMLRDITGKGVSLYDTCRYVPSENLQIALTKLALDSGSLDIDIMFSLEAREEVVSIIAKDTGDSTICQMNLFKKFNHKKNHISNNYQLSDISEIFPYSDLCGNNIYIYIGKSLPLVIKNIKNSYCATSIII